GRLRDREDTPALRDEQAAHVHGRLPRAGWRRRTAMNDAERDAWLREALRHAPDSEALPPSAVSEAILLKARAAARSAAPARLAGSRDAPANPWTALWDWL